MQLVLCGSSSFDGVVAMDSFDNASTVFPLLDWERVVCTASLAVSKTIISYGVEFREFSYESIEAIIAISSVGLPCMSLCQYTVYAYYYRNTIHHLYLLWNHHQQHSNGMT